MHPVTGLLLVVAWAGVTTAPDEPSTRPVRPAVPEPTPEVLQGQARSSWSVDLDAMGGLLAIPTPTDVRRSFLDRYAGVRAGVRRSLGPVRLGGELAFRGTWPAAMGAAPVVPLQLLYFFNRPSSTVRQANAMAAGGTLGLNLGKSDWFLEPMVLVGLSGTMRTMLVMLDLPIPYDMSHPTLGGYAGVGFTTGLSPLLLRMDLLLTHEVGPPPFTHRVFQAQYNVSAGLRF